MKRLIFLDTESTGLTQEDRIIQVAYKLDKKTVNELFNPPVPIKIQAMAIHHITQKQVDDIPPFGGSSVAQELKEVLENKETILVAHNAPFDIAMLSKEGIEVRHSICTKKLAESLDPNAQLDSYSMQYLRYKFGLDVKAVAHDAWGDIIVLEALFNWQVVQMQQEKESVEALYKRMVEITEKPTMYVKFPFGKHKGQLLTDVLEVDKGYLEWLFKQKQMEEIPDVNWLYTLEILLEGTYNGETV